MDNLVESYVQDVLQYLPQKERKDIYHELTANIYGMLPENASEKDIEKVLTEMGSPQKLAEQYRQKPNSPIPAAMHNNYIRALKRFLPIFAGIFVIIGLLFALKSVHDNQPSAWSSDVSFVNGFYLPTRQFWVKAAIKLANFSFSFGLTGLVCTFVFITLVYYVSSQQGKKQTGTWKIEKLKKTPVSIDNQIPLSHSITGLLLGLFFCFLALVYCGGGLPAGFMNKISTTAAFTVYESSHFLASCLEIIVFMAVFTILKYIVQITKRHWTPLVCTVSVLGSLVNMSGGLFLIYMSFTFYEQMMLPKSEWVGTSLTKVVQTASGNILLFSVIAVIVVLHVADAAVALHKTIQYNTVQAQ